MFLSVYAFFSFRVYLRYHTLEQVLLGTLVGAITGSVWFIVVTKILCPYFPSIVNM